MGLVSEQSIYHLDNRTVELEVIPACRHYGVGLIPWSPLGGGLLGGALEKLESGRRKDEQICETGQGKTGASWSTTRRCAASLAIRQAKWRWPGCCTTRS